MNSDLIKVVELIKNNKSIAKKLFYFSSWINSKKDTSLFITDENQELVEGTEWIYQSSLQSFMLVGVFEWEGKFLTHAIDDQTDYAGCINAFQDIPYEIIRRECYYTKDKSVKSYFEKNPDVEKLLNEYEQYCNDQNIKIDKEKVYHDENGDLFNKYFELED